MDEFEALTEEEIRRERQAARRRKLAARERRRRQRRKEAIIRCSILLILVILLLIGIIKMISGIGHLITGKKKEHAQKTEQQIEPTTETPTTEEFLVDSSILAVEMPTDRALALAMIKERADATADTDLTSICENEAVYSDRVLLNLASNAELKNYTINYLTKVPLPFDGDFSMDISTDSVPLLLQYDEQWGYADYGDSLIAYNGAAPTCLSMVTAYLKKDSSYNPIRIGDYAMANQYLDENSKTKWDLFTSGILSFGLTCTEISVNEGNMKAYLDDGNVIICCLQEGDFTKDEHYIVIRGYDDYKFLINDPASMARSAIAWPFERLAPQIKNMWAIGYDASLDTSSSSSEESISNTDSTSLEDSTDNTVDPTSIQLDTTTP